jgi:hypothetical protein
MFSIATSLVLSSLGKVIRTDRLDSAALSSRLAGERESIVAGLPAGLAKFYPPVGATPQDVAATIPSRAPVAAARVATAERQRTAWTWALPAAIAALAVWAIASFFGHSRVPESGRHMTEPGAAATSGFVKRELPGGVSLQFPPNGTEARLLDFIKGNGSITKEHWTSQPIRQCWKAAHRSSSPTSRRS